MDPRRWSIPCNFMTHLQHESEQPWGYLFSKAMYWAMLYPGLRHCKYCFSSNRSALEPYCLLQPWLKLSSEYCWLENGNTATETHWPNPAASFISEISIWLSGWGSCGHLQILLHTRGRIASQVFKLQRVPSVLLQTSASFTPTFSIRSLWPWVFYVTDDLFWNSRQSSRGLSPPKYEDLSTSSCYVTLVILNNLV